MPRARAKSTRHRSQPEPLAKRVGARIRRLREERGFTFDAFVEETQLGRGYISELERGLVVPSVVALSKVARALDVTLADLVLGDSARERLFEATLGMSTTDLERVVAMLKGIRKASGGEAAGLLRIADAVKPKQKPPKDE